MVYIVLSKKRVMTTKTKNNLHIWRIFSANHQQPNRNLYQNKQKLFPSRHKRVDSSSIDTFNQKINSILILYRSVWQ